MRKEKRQVKSFAAGGALSAWLERMAELLYMIPLAYCAGSQLFAYAPVQVFNRVLFEVCCVGIPFGLAPVIASYARRNDSRHVVKTFRQGLYSAACIGIVLCILLMISAEWIAGWILTGKALHSDVTVMANTLRCFAPLCIAEIVIAVYRGVDQGMKRHQDYLSSIFTELGIRVIGILITALFMHQFYKEAKSAVLYVSVIVSLVSVCIPLYQYVQKVKGVTPSAKQDAAVSRRVKKYMTPYVMVILTENVWLILDLFVCVRIGMAGGLSYQEARTFLTMITVEGAVMVQIPLLATFNITAGILPRTEAAASARKKDQLSFILNKGLSDVLTILVPVSMFFIFRGDLVWKVCFGRAPAYLSSQLRWIGVLMAFYCFATEAGYVLASIHQERAVRFYQLFGVAVKAVLLYPLYTHFGISAVLLSSILGFAVTLFLDLSKIKNKADVSYRRLASVFVRTLLAGFAMYGGTVLAAMAMGFDGIPKSRGSALWQLLIMALAGAAVYYMAGDVLHLFRRHKRKK